MRSGSIFTGSYGPFMRTSPACFLPRWPLSSESLHSSLTDMGALLLLELDLLPDLLLAVDVAVAVVPQDPAPAPDPALPVTRAETEPGQLTEELVPHKIILCL